MTPLTLKYYMTPLTLTYYITPLTLTLNIPHPSRRGYVKLLLFFGKCVVRWVSHYVPVASLAASTVT